MAYKLNINIFAFLYDFPGKIKNILCSLNIQNYLVQTFPMSSKWYRKVETLKDRNFY